MARIFLGIPIPNLSPRCFLYISVFLGAAVLLIAWRTLPHYSFNRDPFLSDFQPPFNVSLPKHEDVDFISGPHYPAPAPTGRHNYKKDEWDEDLKHQDSDFISSPHYPAPTPTGSHNNKKDEWDEDSKHQDSDFISSPHYPAPALTGSNNYKKAEWDEDSKHQGSDFISGPHYPAPTPTGRHNYEKDEWAEDSKHQDSDFISSPHYPAPATTGSYNYKKAEWDEDSKHEDSDFISGSHYPAPTSSHNYKKAEWDEDSNYLVDFSSTYKEMESKFKVYMYRDDVLNKYYKFPFPTTDPDSFTWEYRDEGYFFSNINKSTFLTTDPKQAQLFFIPIRTHLMQSEEPSYEEMEIVVQNYVQSLIQEHPYWNRSQGVDHFFVHCREAIDVPLLNNAIRVLCATQDVRQFNPSMDVFLPPLGYDIYPAGFNLSSGYDFIDRKRIVASKILKDLKIDVCSCSIALYYYYACLAEAIVENCIPVVSLSYHELPYNNTLDWTKFSVIDSEGDVLVNNIQEQLQEIVKDIEDETLIKLFSNLRKVQSHFVWHKSPVKFDAFHMFMYQLWLHINQ